MEWSMKAGRIRTTLGALGTGLHPHILAASQPSESQRVNPFDRIGRVLLQIETASKTYRVVTNETARRSVIVPMPVVVKAAFLIYLLALN